MRVDQVACARPGEPERHRVDREVAARQVVVDRPGLDVRQRSRVGIALATGEVDVERAPREGRRRGAEPWVGQHLRVEAPHEVVHVVLDDQVEVRSVGAPEQGVAHHASDGADPTRERGLDARHQRVREDPLAGAAARIVGVAYDPVSRKLADVAPVAPELLEAFARFEGLTLTELQDRVRGRRPALPDLGARSGQRRPAHRRGPRLPRPNRARQPPRAAHLGRVARHRRRYRGVG